MKCGPKFMYEDSSRPLFKTASYDVYSKVYGSNLERLKNFGVYYFSNFMITSKTASMLGGVSEDEKQGNIKLIFEIYMNETKQRRTNRGGLPTSIDLSSRLEK